MATIQNILDNDGNIVYPQTIASAVLVGDTPLDEALYGSSNAASISNLDETKKFIVATITASASFSLASVPSAGKEVHVIIRNSGSSKITITIPNSGNYINCGEDTIDIEASSYGEVNAISDGTKVYLRAASK